MKLKPHQIAGAEWLQTKHHGLLADEMRVGKTLTAIHGADLIDAKRILVVCPAVGRANWAKMFTENQAVDRVVRTILGAAALPLAPLGEPEVAITSYELMIPSGFPGGWDLLILDEAHYLRHCDSRRAKQVLGKQGIVHKAKRTWALTGTPAVNHAAEMWPLLHVFGVYKGTYESFVQEFCTGYSGQWGFKITGTKNADGLKALLTDVMLRRRFTEVAPELAPIDFSDYAVESPSDTGIDLAEEELVRNALQAPDQVVALEQLAASVATLRRYTGLAKAGAAVDLVNYELANGRRKLVLFAVHREVIALLMEQLAEYNPALIYGGVSATARQAAVDRFRDDFRCQVFIGQVTAAGTCIDLSAADDAIFVEYSWVPGDNAQAAMRIQNLHASSEKTVRFLTLARSIDESITRVYRRKIRDLANIFD